MSHDRPIELHDSFVLALIASLGVLLTDAMISGVTRRSTYFGGMAPNHTFFACLWDTNGCGSGLLRYEDSECAVRMSSEGSIVLTLTGSCGVLTNSRH